MMYTRATRAGVVISTISADPARSCGRECAAFSFRAMSPQGARYIFRYQSDERGNIGWHLYAGDGGSEYPDMDRRKRDSLATLPVSHTDQDIERLIESIENIPGVSILVIVPIHPASELDADFMVFPMTTVGAARIRALDSLSGELVGLDNTAQKMSSILFEAAPVYLSKDERLEYNKNPNSELGRIHAHLRRNGFYIYISSNRMIPPPFIKKAMSESGSEPFYLERNGDDDLDGAIMSGATGQPVGMINNIQGIMDRFAEITRQAIRLADAVKSQRRKEQKEQKEQKVKRQL